jgi:hypothetical protein
MHNLNDIFSCAAPSCSEALAAKFHCRQAILQFSIMSFIEPACTKPIRQLFQSTIAAMRSEGKNASTEARDAIKGDRS